MDRLACEAAADLLRYPDARARQALLEAGRLLLGCSDVPAEPLHALMAFLEGSAPEDLEEHFTRTFDINPLCTLEIGWHLYGEDYARGAFLVQMRELMRDLGVEEGTELPDHLPSMLRVLGRLHPVKAEGFSRGYLQPALAKMVAGYVAEDDAPYRGLLAAILTALEASFGATDAEEVALPPAQAVPYERGARCGPTPTPTGVASFPKRPPA